MKGAGLCREEVFTERVGAVGRLIGTGTGTHKLYWHVTHLQSKLPKQYLKDL